MKIGGLPRCGIGGPAKIELEPSNAATNREKCRQHVYHKEAVARVHTQVVADQPGRVKIAPGTRYGTPRAGHFLFRLLKIAGGQRCLSDALEIESLAKRRLADEYDAAQDRGEIRGANTGRSASALEAPNAEEIGLSHKEIYEARIIRDAEAADPGVTRRALLKRGDEPSERLLDRGLPQSTLQFLDAALQSIDACDSVAGVDVGNV